MSQKEDLIQLLGEARASRRNLLKQAATGSVVLAAGALATSSAFGSPQSGASTSRASVTPVDVLNFALNLEFLEAEYYSFAVTGSGIDAGVNGDVFPTGGPVTFSNYGGIAHAIYTDETNHVKFLQGALGTAAVSRPPIDLVNSFNAAAQAAGIGSSFNPFASETDFILGSFVFEDVGVTAYHGGAGYLASSPYLSAAAGILGVEAYHAGAIRRIIAQMGGTVLSTANKISALRAAADQAAGGTGDETSLPANVAADSSNAVAFARTPAEVLNIVYLNASSTAASKGGFFPQGMTGNITVS